MESFGGADTKQWTWSISPASKRCTVKPLSLAISCARSFRNCSIWGGDDLPPVLHAPHHMVVYITHTSPVFNDICFHTYSISQRTYIRKRLFAYNENNRNNGYKYNNRKRRAIPLGDWITENPYPKILNRFTSSTSVKRRLILSADDNSAPISFHKWSCIPAIIRRLGRRFFYCLHHCSAVSCSRCIKKRERASPTKVSPFLITPTAPGVPRS